MKKKPAAEHLKTLAQVLAILLLAGIVAMVVHKGAADFTTLRQTAGDDFGKALLRYVLRNLAG